MCDVTDILSPNWKGAVRLTSMLLLFVVEVLVTEFAARRLTDNK
jgi:hypothetical protein